MRDRVEERMEIAEKTKRRFRKREWEYSAEQRYPRLTSTSVT